MKKLPQLLLLLLLAGISPSLMAKTANGGKAQIKGKTIQEKPTVIEIIIKDSPLDNFPDSYVVTPDTAGYFNLDLPVSHFSEGVIILGRTRYKIILMPGDHLQLTVDGTKLSYEGKGSERNNLLYALKNAGLSNLQSPPETLGLCVFADSLKGQKHKRMEFLKNSRYQKAIEPEFKKWFGIDTEVQYEQILLDRIGPSDSILPPGYRRTTNLRNLLNDKKIYSGSYFNLVNKHYLSGKPYKQTSLKFESEGMDKSAASYKAKNELLEKLPPVTKEYMLAYLLRQELVMLQQYDTLRLKWFYSIAKDSAAIRTVNLAVGKLKFKESLVGKKLHPEFSGTLLADTAGNLLTFGEMMEKHKGKVVYLDIWSLSCPPCRAAMPGSKLLRKKLAGLPVVFVYLVPDNYPNQWANIKNLTGTLENNYQLSKGFNSRLLRSMEIFWVPVYMIFDKQGRLANYHAPAPMHVKATGTDMLEEQLRRLADD